MKNLCQQILKQNSKFYTESMMHLYPSEMLTTKKSIINFKSD
jgi:hypothetical protein